LTSSLLAERVGSQTPRVGNWPSYPLTAAPEVIDLAASAGLYLDDWQKLVLTHGLGHRVDEQWTARKIGCWVPRQNGKGGIIEALELAWLFLFDEELVIHSAHQHRTSAKAYQRLERMIRATPDMHRRVRQYRQANGEQQIELWDGRLLQYVTRSRTAVRGFSAPKIVFDEAQELTGDQMGAVLPTVSAMPNWQTWFFGTPPDDQTAWCYGLKEDGESGALRVAWFDWGSDLDPELEPERVRDSAEWLLRNPALGIRITMETVEDECKPSGLGDKFPRERLGVWQPRLVDGSGLIDADLWATLADKERPGDRAFALVVNRERTRSAIGYAGVREDGRLQVGLSDWMPGTAKAVERLLELRERWSPVGFAVATRSESLLLDLEKAGITVPEDPDEPQRGDLAVPSAAQEAAAFGGFLDAVRNDRLRHADDAPVSTALAQGRTRPVSGGTAWDDRHGEVAPIRAASLALWLFESWAHLVADDYAPEDQIF
jgi:hypothetical protein